MAVCIECGKDVVANYHTIQTKRNTKHYLCYECAKRKSIGQNNARNSK